MIKRHSTYANVMATVALFVALGGVAWAVNKAPKDSVVTKSIVDQAVTAKKIKDGSVAGKDIKNGSVSGADIDVPSLQIPGIDPDSIQIRTELAVGTIGIGGTQALEAQCNSGEAAIGGGSTSDNSAAALSSSGPVIDGADENQIDGWSSTWSNPTGNELSVTLKSYVFCVPAD